MTMKKILAPVIITLLVLGWSNIIGGTATRVRKYNKYMTSAKVLDEKGIYIDALDQYKKALEFTKDKFAAQEAILDDYLNLKKYKDFERQANTLLENYNYPEGVTKKLVQYYTDRKQAQNALKVVNTYLAKKPANEEFIELQGKLRGTYTEVYLGKDSVDGCYNGFYIFTEKEKRGILKFDGTEKIKAEYENIYPYGDAPVYAASFKDNEWFYIDKDGYKKLVPDFKVDFLGVYGNDLAPYSYEGKYSYIESHAKQATEESWDFAGGFANKRAAVKRDGKWAVIKNDFSTVTDYIYDDVITDDFGFCTVGDVYIAKLDGKYHIFDLNGSMKGIAGFDMAKPFKSDEPTAVDIDGKWGFADTAGNIEMMTDYKEAKAFSKGFAPVFNGKKWGYVDRKGVTVIDCEFDEANSFNDSGFAAVKKSSWKLIKLIE